MKRLVAVCIALLMFLPTLGATVCAQALDYELHSFGVGSEKEKSYLVKEGSVSSSGIRYADAKNSFIYCFEIRNTVNIQKIELSGMIYQQLHLSVSTDGENYTTVYRYETTDPDDHGLSRAKRTFDLTEFVDLKISKTIYVCMTDAYTANGWGGAISPKEPVSLKVSYIKPTVEELNALEMTRTEHRVPVFGCNSAWGGGYVLDTTDPSAGYAALALTLRDGDTAASVVLDEPVDARGMDTLEFELYVSDISVFDLPFSGHLTLSSDGCEDAAALRWSIRAVLAAIEQKQQGWNHVVLPLSTASAVNGSAGKFDLGAINYIGLGWTDMPAVAGSPLWKVDSFCLTDRQKAAREDILMEKSYLVEQIRTLEELIEEGIDEGSFKTVARLTANSRYEISHLTQEELAVILALGLVASVDEAEQLVAAYEERIVSDVPVDDEIILPEQEQPKTEPEKPDEPIVEPQTSEQDGGYAWWFIGAAMIVSGAAAVVAAWLVKKRK